MKHRDVSTTVYTPHCPHGNITIYNRNVTGMTNRFFIRTLLNPRVKTHAHEIAQHKGDHSASSHHGVSWL